MPWLYAFHQRRIHSVGFNCSLGDLYHFDSNSGGHLHHNDSATITKTVQLTSHVPLGPVGVLG